MRSPILFCAQPVADTIAAEARNARSDERMVGVGVCFAETETEIGREEKKDVKSVSARTVQLVLCVTKRRGLIESNIIQYNPI
jgi:hypothetical protein